MTDSELPFRDLFQEESRLRKEAVKAENKQKKLADICEEELHNDPAMLDATVRANLNHPGDTGIVDQPSDNVAHIFKLIMRDDPDFEADAFERIDHILAAISDTSNIDPCLFGPDSEPKDWLDSQRRPSIEAAEWKTAFEEFTSLYEMGIYVLVPQSDVPTGRKIHRGRAVLKNKIGSLGELTHRKVRLCFRGFEQIYGRDFTSTTSPTARMESWRILLHIAAVLGWDMQQINIKTAFLYGLLPDDETQYMEQPEGFEEPGKEDHVWKLQRSLYGMKQAVWIWNRTMNDAMLSWGFNTFAYAVVI